MQKELLLAIGDDRASSFNLRFLKEVYDNFCDLKLTLFYVAPRLAVWSMEENNIVPSGESLDAFLAHKKDKGERALEEAKSWITNIAGCSGDNVTTKVVHSRKGTVQELIDEARSGLYDALLLGRKGFTWFEEIFINSVCHEILWQDLDFPIWVCKRPPDNPRHDVLLPVDGSPASLRMVDHAAYMLATEKRHTFTLLHVTKDSFTTSRTSRIFDEALDVLSENDIEEERIELKMVKASNETKAIVKEANDGNYSAVGVGRHTKQERTRFENLFPSSVTINLLRNLNTALWISK